MNQAMVWLRLVGSLKLYVSFAKEPYKRDHTLQKRPIISRSLLIVATPHPAHIFNMRIEVCRLGEYTYDTMQQSTHDFLTPYTHSDSGV